MEIKQVNNATKGYFEMVDGEKQAGRMTYSRIGDTKIIIDHTEVDNAYNGQGIGLKLVLAAVDYARKNNIKIIPLCPFAKSVFDKKPELHDVLDAR